MVRGVLTAIATVLMLTAAANAQELNIYSSRQEALLKPQLDAFAAQTGAKINLVTGEPKELIQRLQTEKSAPRADLFFTTDAGNLVQAKSMGLFQAVKSAVLEESIPAQFRDPDGLWFGLGMRARPIFYVPGKVDPAKLTRYEDLADPAWKGQILVRSSTHVYNQSLLASIIAADGPVSAEQWTNGVAGNLARKPQGGDRDQIKAAAAGAGAIALVNTYYYAQMLDSKQADEREAAAKLKVIWPNQADRGVHVNVSGAGVVANGPNRAMAVRLLEFLVGDEAQRIYAEVGQEYPVKPEVPVSAALKALGTFKADQLNLAKLGELNVEAVKMFDRSGWR